MFTGFQEETVRFFLDLRFHNNSTWFHEHHDRYRSVVVEPFYDLIGDLAPCVLNADPGMEIRPHKCLSRINRDIRFSKDKSPYRDHLWFVFRHAAEPREGSLNFWFEFGPDRLSWGLGFWGENREVMDALRKRMAACPDEYLELINSCALPEHHMVPAGRCWKRIDIPEGLPSSLLPWYTARELEIPRMMIDQQWAFEPGLTERIRSDWEACFPIYRMLRGFYE